MICITKVSLTSIILYALASPETRLVNTAFWASNLLKCFFLYYLGHEEVFEGDDLFGVTPKRRLCI
jgi:hypothetical protein